jgi:ankyrin repeat protein
MDIVQALFDNGADVTVTTRANGDTPLHIACYNGHTEVVELLLNNNADIDVTSASGKTPLRPCLHATSSGVWPLTLVTVESAPFSRSV